MALCHKNNRGKEITPTGICGSGVISVVAELLRTSIMMPDGRLNKNFVTPALEMDGGSLFFRRISGPFSSVNPP
ncbi:MAG: ASKHA domain-containing protein [Desulfobacterium sp.]|jgi:uncharacterized 2Fe-2S/4Fe-4S cluster protein (DUF4445 family)|nr:ASKHA domain-containing protein [Desulfobacterium sp.]